MQLLADGHQCPVYSVRTVTRNTGLGRTLIPLVIPPVPSTSEVFCTIPGTRCLFQDYPCGAKHAITTEGALQL